MRRGLLAGLVGAVVVVAAAVALVALSGRSAEPVKAVLPQPPDSDAPPGAPPHWIPPDHWVQQHWLPYDEARLVALLRTNRLGLWRHLRDDQRTLAGLAARRGWPDARRLASALVAPRRSAVSPALARDLERRALRTLTQGHLSQHMLFHTLHQETIPNRARSLFGISVEEFRRLRRLDISPLQVARMHGRSAATIEALAARSLREKAGYGVSSGQISAMQAALLLQRQLRQLPRWLGESHYNGPPRTDRNGRLLETPQPAWQHPVIAEAGRRIVFEAYEPKLPLARTRGEISVVAWDSARRRATPISHLAPAAALGPFSAYNPVVSTSGRWTAFETSAGNLNFAKRYGDTRVVVADRRTARIRDMTGSPANGGTRTAYAPAISGDGRVLAFQAVDAGAASLGHDTRIVVRRNPAGRARTVARPPAQGGARAGRSAFEPSLSRDGRMVAFTAPAVLTDHRPAQQVYVLDRLTGHIELASRAEREGRAGDGESWDPQLSADGRLVAFASAAENLGAGSPAVGESRIFVRDLRSARTTVVSTRDGRALPGFADEPAIAADGSAVAFSLAPPRALERAKTGRPPQAVYRHQLNTGATVLISPTHARSTGGRPGWSGQASISKHGADVAFASDAGDPKRGDGAAIVAVLMREVATGRTVEVTSPTSFAPAHTTASAAHHTALCHLAPPAW